MRPWFPSLLSLLSLLFLLSACLTASLFQASPALGDSQARATVAPAEPRLYELSRENQIRTFYEVVARNLQAAGHELTLDVRNITTIPREDFAQYRTHQVFTVGEGVSLHVRPQKGSTSVEMPDGSRQEIDRFITFDLEWEPDYWLMNADPERARLLEKVKDQTFAEYVLSGAAEDKTLRNVEAVTSVEIKVEFERNQRVYRAAALWYHEGTTERTFLLIDQALLQLESAFNPQRPIRRLSEADVAAKIPDELRLAITKKRGEASGLEHSETQCKPFSRKFPLSSFKQGFVEHSGSGEHQSSADIEFTCRCDTACTSNCSATFPFTNCRDFDPIASGRKHVAAEGQNTSDAARPNAWDIGATCTGGYGCVFRSCSIGTPCGVSVSVNIAGTDVSFSDSGATYSLNSEFSLQGGCPKCEVDTECMKLGEEMVCGSEPEPIPTEPCSGPCLPTPLVVDVDRDGFRFSGRDAWVEFDIDADGLLEKITWTDPTADDAFLVLDRNGDGIIDDGKELFGEVTAQPESGERNGFRALAVFDEESQGGNGDGVITSADAVFQSLRLWKDVNQDGVSQASELRSLQNAEIRGIQLSYVTSKRRDRHGNMLRWTSFVQFEDQARFAASDVIFVAVPD